MATINWPSDLPQCFLPQGFSESTPDNLLRDNFDVGPPSLRPRSSLSMFPVSGNMKITTEQWETLKAFRADELLQGSLPFGFPPQYSTASAWLVLMPDPPQRSKLGANKFLVSISLVVIEVTA